MAAIITNRITLCGAEQEKINEVFDFLNGENGEMDFNKIIQMPKELEYSPCSSLEDDAWAYYEAKELGNFEEIDKLLTSYRYIGEGITTREQLFSYMEEQHISLEKLLPDRHKSGFDDIYEYGKNLHYLEQKYGFHDWYAWSMANWECSCNAFDMEKEGNVLTFFTAEDVVPALMLKVSEKFPEVTFNYEFASEWFSHDVGRYVFQAGEVISEYEPEECSPEAKILAKQILGWEPGEDEEMNYPIYYKEDEEGEE